MTFTVERLPADISQEAFTELGAFLYGQALPMSCAPIDMETACRNGYAAIAQGMTLVAREPGPDGQIIGSLSLIDHELHGWSLPEHRCLVDAWFVVDPGHRHGGRVRKALMAAGKVIADEKGLRGFVFRRVALG